eukprot:TRINITY_DN376_c4_g1_i1.p1 TRINITY_DN376_c4_g1~~TRINITY_DN376_c4_g1_i1.p1  ORF type:complete len:882 (+),score=197.11 TRINITY_DN376_c4_g1_i1:94-2739(+)
MAFKSTISKLYVEEDKYNDKYSKISGGQLLSPRYSNENNNTFGLKKILRRKTRSISDLNRLSPPELNPNTTSASPSTPPTSSPLSLTFSPLSMSPPTYNNSDSISPIHTTNIPSIRRTSMSSSVSNVPTSTTSLTSLSSPEDKAKAFVRKLLKKLLLEERNYLHGIGGIAQGYLVQMNPELISKEQRDAIFCNIEEIYHIHITLRPELEEALKLWPKVKLSGTFYSISQFIQSAYLTYVSNLPNATLVLETLTKQNKLFATFLKNCENHHSIPPLATLITIPIDRIDSYLDFLQQFIEHFKTENTENYVDEKELVVLNEVSELIEDFSHSFHTRENIANSMNAVMEISNSMEGLDDNLVRPGRRVVREGPVTIMVPDQTKPVANYVHLFNDLLIFSKVKGKKPKDGGFIFLTKIWLYRLDLKDIKGDSTDAEFDIVCGKATYQMIASSLTEKDEWVWDISYYIREVEKTKKVFGVPLKTLSQRENNNDIPNFLKKSVTFITNHALDCEGIFRQTGRSTQVEHLKDLYNQGKKVFFNSELNPHSVAELIKVWLCELPERLVPWELYQDYLRFKPLGEDILVQEMSKVLGEKTSRYGKEVLQFVMKMLFRVGQRQELNKMTFANIGMVFGPCLLFYDESAAKDPREIAQVYKNMQDLVACLVQNYKTFFSRIEHERKHKRLERDEDGIGPRGSRVEFRRNNRLSLTLNTTSDVQLLQSIEKDLQHKASMVSLHSREDLALCHGHGTGPETSSSSSSSYILRRSIDVRSFISKEGWLKKKSAKNFKGGWSVLWFVLKYKSLTYFSSNQDTRPKGTIVLRGCVVGRNSLKPNCFYVNFPNKSYLFIARDEKERSEWLHSLRDCIENETDNNTFPHCAVSSWDAHK